jgi:TATA-box binding protein (TBP) (component of TFIID and TFIIIB)
MNIMELHENSFKVETQTFKFISQIPVKHHDAVTLAGGIRNGEHVIIAYENPKSTIVIDPSGAVIVHNISRQEVAKSIVQKFLLSIGMSDEKLNFEKGEILVEFALGKAVLIELAEDRFTDIVLDEKIGALRIDAKRHNCRIILFNNGRGVVLGQTSKRVAELATKYWLEQLEKEGALA